MRRRSTSTSPILLRDSLEVLREQLDVVDVPDSERIRLIVIAVIGERLAAEVIVGKITDRTISVVAQSSHGAGALRTKVGRIRQALRDEGFPQSLVVEFSPH